VFCVLILFVSCTSPPLQQGHSAKFEKNIFMSYFICGCFNYTILFCQQVFAAVIFVEETGRQNSCVYSFAASLYW
jgi:hypothetical protein